MTDESHPLDLTAKLDHLREQSPEAYDLLAFSAFLGLWQIPYEPYLYDRMSRRTDVTLFKGWYHTPEFQEEEARMSAILESLEATFRYVWEARGSEQQLTWLDDWTGALPAQRCVMSSIQYNAERHWYRLSERLQSVMNARMTSEERRAMADRVIHARFWSLPDYSYGWAYHEDFRRFESQYEHAAECTGWFEAEGICSEMAAGLLMEVSDALATEWRFVECEHYYQQALAMCEALGEKAFAACYSRYASFLEAHGRYPEAESMRRRAEG